MAVKIFQLGLIDYLSAYSLQKEIFSRVLSGRISHALILCRHNPVVTAGRRISEANECVSAQALKERNIEFFRIERGGDLTYHGPGQITVYPIFNLAYLKKDIHLYLRYLEGVVLSFLRDFGVSAERKSNLTGAWVGDKKIASIGIAVRHWVTFHGLSININEGDLAGFSLFKPCGRDTAMTSLETELRREVSIKRMFSPLTSKFQETLGVYYA